MLDRARGLGPWQLASSRADGVNTCGPLRKRVQHAELSGHRVGCGGLRRRRRTPQSRAGGLVAARGCAQHDEEGVPVAMVVVVVDMWFAGRGGGGTTALLCISEGIGNFLSYRIGS